MKHRSGAKKIKYEYHMIKGLRKFLESIEFWEEIQSIIPGRIKRARPRPKLMLSIQYPTTSGLKCIAKSGSSVQEVFIVTSFPEKLTRRLEALSEKN